MTRVSKAALCALLLALVSRPASADWLSYTPKGPLEPPRGVVWRPLGSFFLPGLGQYMEGQMEAGSFYTAIGVTGLGLAANATSLSTASTDAADELDKQTGLQRQYTYGMQLYMLAGELSAFSAFQTAVQTRKPLGQYGFITHDEESVSELLLAPFEFSHVLRPTTFIPLLLLGTVVGAGLETGDHLDFGDSAFVGGVSYNAGVGEEALFRGYMMPALRQSWGSDFWSNATQSVIFGAAHYSDSNRFPLAQGLMGFYLGWLCQRNGWSVRQSIFLHAWWDVLALGAQIAHENGRTAVAKPIPLFTLPF